MPHQGQSGIYFISGGCRLLGTLFLARGDEPKPTAILLHGIPGIEKNYDLAHGLRANGWNSLIFHYRGCWGSQGQYSFETIPEDVIAALDFLCVGTFPQIDTSELYLVGHSLGGWAAVIVAARDARVRGIATIAPIADPRELHFTELMALQSYTPWLSGLSPSEFVTQWHELGKADLPIEKVCQISPRPVLIVHGRNDELVPVAQSENLFDHSLEPRELFLHDEANHSFVWHRQWLVAYILDWLRKVSTK